MLIYKYSIISPSQTSRIPVSLGEGGFTLRGGFYGLLQGIYTGLLRGPVTASKRFVRAYGLEFRVELTCRAQRTGPCSSCILASYRTFVRVYLLSICVFVTLHKPFNQACRMRASPFTATMSLTAFLGKRFLTQDSPIQAWGVRDVRVQVKTPKRTEPQTPKCFWPEPCILPVSYPRWYG